MAESDYVIRVHTSPLDIDAVAWDTLLRTQADATPFMCGSGEQVPVSYSCDGEPDCMDMSDEAMCP